MASTPDRRAGWICRSARAERVGRKASWAGGSVENGDSTKIEPIRKSMRRDPRRPPFPWQVPCIVHDGRLNGSVLNGPDLPFPSAADLLRLLQLQPCILHDFGPAGDLRADKGAELRTRQGRDLRSLPGPGLADVGRPQGGLQFPSHPLDNGRRRALGCPERIERG